MDELWTHPWRLEGWHEVLEGFQWWSVMLTAPLDTLAARGPTGGLAITDMIDHAERPS